MQKAGAKGGAHCWITSVELERSVTWSPPARKTDDSIGVYGVVASTTTRCPRFASPSGHVLEIDSAVFTPTAYRWTIALIAVSVLGAV